MDRSPSPGPTCPDTGAAPADTGSAGPCSYSPHKVLHLINITAWFFVSRYPRSAARTRTQHIVNTRCSSHSSEPMSTCFRCVFTAQEFVSLAAEFSFWPLLFTQIKQNVPHGGNASASRVQPLCLFFFSPLTNDRFTHPFSLKCYYALTLRMQIIFYFF